MSYHKNRKKISEWREWIRRNHSRIVDCGVPHEIIAEKMRWAVFIDHSQDQWSGWDIDNLSKKQARNLFEFLIEECGEGFDDNYRILVAILDSLECIFAGHSSRNQKQWKMNQESDCENAD